MLKIGFCFCLVYLIIGLTPGKAQSTKKVKDSTKNLRITVLPVAFYLPETGLGYGVLGLSTFRLPREGAETRPSSIQLGLTLTTKKQFLLFMPFEFYLDNEKWRFTGELGYYKYFYNYFGRGINSNQDNEETYTADFPRFRLKAYREVLPKFSFGMGYEFDGYNVLKPEPNGLLDNSNEIGKGGGTVSNLGLLALYDNRNNIFYPTKGWYVEGAMYTSSKWLGSSFSYNKFELDARYFQKIKGKQVLASNLFLGTRSDGTPFQDLNYLGTKRTRGFDNRRFLDKTELSLTTEYRFPIWRRFNGAVFGSTSTLSPTLEDIFSTTYKSAIGGGIRYIVNKKEGTRLRVDYGHSSEGGQFYFTINEAF
jgi:outer membrane protein assembly factor BamA